MSELLKVDVDRQGLTQALTRLGPAVEPRLKAAARATADRIRDEARARVRRRTGQTAGSLTVEESHDGRGYVVFAATDPANLDIWLEFGTRHMEARPFLHASAQLEEGPHERRIQQAINDAIQEVGLGR